MVPLPAMANNTQTVNSSNAYVDLSIAAAFTTIPNLCSEPVGSQNTTTTACNALGAAAVSAINGSGLSPDQYFEGPASGPLFSTNSFVPSNVGAQFTFTGYAPIFSQHKYNLFGRSGEFMGPLTREEMLFVTLTNNLAGRSPSQTQPGSDEIQKMITSILVEPEGSTTVTFPPGGGPGSVTFNIADLPTYTAITGFTTGKLATINAYCSVVFPPVTLPRGGGVFNTCGLISDEIRAIIYLAGNLPGGLTAPCGSAGTGGLTANGCDARDQWVDQVVVGYIESFDDPNNPTATLLKQNFRSQVFQDQSNALTPATETLIDFRMEQEVALGQTAFEASRQTLQQSMATVSGSGAGTIQGHNWGQLITQDVEGWFYSCLNCDSTVNNVSHAFTPILQGMTFMPYTSTWRDLPSISHGASGGNLSTYAQAPGQPGP